MSVALGVLNSILAVALLISYIIQCHRIKHRNGPSSDGISPDYILLRAIFGISNMAAFLMLPRSLERMQLCNTDVKLGECLVETSSMWPVAVDWICSQVLIMLYLWYTRGSLYLTGSGELWLVPRRRMKALTLLYPFALNLLLLVPSMLFFVLSLDGRKIGGPILRTIWTALATWCSLVSAAVYLIPQIRHTRQNQKIGNLSVRSVAIQTVTYLLMAGSIAIQYGMANRGVLANYWGACVIWINYALSGIMSGVLLSLTLHSLITGSFRRPRPVIVLRKARVDEKAPLLVKG